MLMAWTGASLEITFLTAGAKQFIRWLDVKRLERNRGSDRADRTVAAVVDCGLSHAVEEVCGTVFSCDDL
jgi:hypothetical protein